MKTHRTNKILIGGVAALVGALVAAGVIAAMVTDSDGDDSSRTRVVATTVTTPPGPSGNEGSTSSTVEPTAPGSRPAPQGGQELITVHDAATRARADIPGKVIEIESDHHRGRPVWEVHVATEDTIEELTIDARTGEVLDTETDHDAEDTALAARARLAADEAATKATAVVPGEIISVELDDHRGAVVYEVEVVGDRARSEVLVDAVTGEIVRTSAGRGPVAGGR